ncbi:MAG: hypothetical protein ACREB7_15720 [Sphingopyxis sp.]|uniref:hypothetical protein n=1 Tax=Sphingopyxis sp. TaxID=1908224 RepID=UPI003D6D86B0
MHRPPSIILFERLLWTSFAISVVTTYLAWNDMMAEIEHGAAGMRSSTAIGITMFIFAVTLAILAALWYAIARRGSNVAKWIYVVLVALGTLQTIASLFEPNSLSTMWLGATLLVTALSVGSAAVLFRSDAVAWLAGKGPVDPGVFN